MSCLLEWALMYLGAVALCLFLGRYEEAVQGKATGRWYYGQWRLGRR